MHVVAALDERGAELGVRPFATTTAGHRALLAWLRGFGAVERVGVEGTGSYGAGLARFLHAESVTVVEVNRPNRQLRRSHGKSDPVDAVAAARAAQSGQAAGEAKTRNGAVEAIRAPGSSFGATWPRHRHRQAQRCSSAAPTAFGRPSPGQRVRVGERRRRGSARSATAMTAAGATCFALRELRRVQSSKRRASGSTACWSRSSLPLLRSSWLPTAWAPTQPARSSSPPATIPSACAARRPSPTSVASRRSTPPRATRRKGVNRASDRSANNTL